MKTLVSVLLLALHGVSAAMDIPARNGMEFPGYDSVSLGLGGFRSVGFGDPMCLHYNPACISMRYGSSLLCISAGPVMSDVSFSNGSENYSDSWTEGMGVYSFGMKFPVLEELVLGFASGRTAALPLRELYYIPGAFSGGGNTEGSVEISGEFSELVMGFSWDALDWLSIGAAAGSKTALQSFDVSYRGATGFITHLNYQRSALSLKGGIALPFEPVTLGLAWSSEGNFSPSRLSLGGTVDLTTDFKMGSEFERASLDERTVYTGRMFGSVFVLPSVVLRGGLFYSSATEAVSREGLGFSLGAGYRVGKFLLNGAYSWSPLEGDRDYYGYSDLESFSGNSPVVSVGLEWGKASPLQ